MKYIDGRTEPVTKPLALGKAVHKAVEQWINGKSEDEAVLDAFIEADFHPEVQRKEIVDLLRRVPAVSGETEVHFELPLAAHPSAPRIQGYIDLVQEKSFIDWKTNWRPYGANDTMQLSLYAWALMELRGWDTVKGKLYFQRFRRAESYDYTRSEANAAQAWAYKLVKEIQLKVFTVELFPEMKSTSFPPSPGSHCKHCPFAQECYAQFAA